MRRAPTPGPGGYLVGVLVSIVVLTASLAAMSGELSAHRPGEWVPVVLFVGFFTSIAALPVGLAGVLFVHFWCRRIEQQWVHVIAAGLSGVLQVMGVATILGGPGEAVGAAPFAALLALAAALGRAAVIPMRPRLAPPAGQRLAEPVDDDFAPERSAC